MDIHDGHSENVDGGLDCARKYNNLPASSWGELDTGLNSFDEEVG